MNKVPKYNPKEVLHPYEFEVISFKDLYRSKTAQGLLNTPHRVPFYHIFWFQGEKSSHFINYRRIDFQKNTLLFINKDTIHHFSKEKCKGEIILFSDSFFCNSAENIEYLNNTMLFNGSYSAILSLSDSFPLLIRDYFELMKQEIGKNLDRKLAIFRNLLYNLLLLSDREYQSMKNILEEKESADYMTQFKILLDANFKENRQVTFYANALGITEKYLNQIITDQKGKTPKEFIVEKVFFEAKRMLKHTTLSVKEIAYELGFDPVYFVKFFKKYSSMTPAHYRKDQPETS